MHVRRLLALALAGPVLLAGCSDEAEPTPKLPDPPSSSASPTPDETETPEAESPKDFIRRWVEVNTQMQNTGEVAEYVELSSKCEPCRQTAERIERIYSDGGYVRTEGWVIRKVIDRSGAGGGPVLDLQIESSPTEYKERASGEVKSLSGGDIVMRVRLSRAAPWRVVRLTQVPS